MSTADDDMADRWQVGGKHAPAPPDAEPTEAEVELAAGWQPIETAPDGTSVILFAYTEMLGDGRNWKMASGWRRKNDEWEWDGRKVLHYDWQPTHWQPLPAPPKEPDDAR